MFATWCALEAVVRGTVHHTTASRVMPPSSQRRSHFNADHATKHLPAYINHNTALAVITYCTPHGLPTSHVGDCQSDKHWPCQPWRTRVLHCAIAYLHYVIKLAQR